MQDAHQPYHAVFVYLFVGSSPVEMPEVLVGDPLGN